MKPQLSILTLGVDDLEVALAFYRDGLGLATDGIVGTEFEHGAVVFIDFQPGLKLALFSRRDLAHDSGLSAGRGAADSALGHLTGSAAEVDAVLARAVAVGAILVKAGQPTFWGGYAGYFQDPDGHLWEIAFNPAVDPGA